MIDLLRYELRVKWSTPTATVAEGERARAMKNLDVYFMGTLAYEDTRGFLFASPRVEPLTALRHRLRWEGRTFLLFRAVDENGEPLW